MRRDARGLILAVVALMLLRLSLTDDYLQYVKASMRPWLVISGVLLGVLAAVDIFGLLPRPGEADDDHDHDDDVEHENAHGHEHGHRHSPLPWILVVPFVVVFAIGPSPLGSFMADRQASSERVAADGSSDATSGDGLAVSDYPDLPDAVDGAVELDLVEFVTRAVRDDERQMEGELIRLEGFVTSDDEGPGDTFRLTRFMVSCCAADGIPISIRAHGLNPIPEVDTWLRVEGYWIAHEGDELPDIDEFEIVTSEEIPAPADPYV